MQKGDWDFIRKHKIIGLVETWEEEVKGYVERELADFDIKQKMAKKESGKRGRARGRMVLTIKRHIGMEIVW